MWYEQDLKYQGQEEKKVNYVQKLFEDIMNSWSFLELLAASEDLGLFLAKWHPGDDQLP